MEWAAVLVVVVIAIGAILFFFFRPTQKVEAVRLGEPAKPSTPDHNQIIVPLELGKEPNLEGTIVFPPRPAAPVTRFEDFNQRLFLLKISSDCRWPGVLVQNDFPTRLEGTIDWVRGEIHAKLRPRYPVILDTFGYWASASQMLEINPSANTSVIQAYLSLPLEQRPVVVSTTEKQADAKLTSFRYQFADYQFDPKFLRGDETFAFLDFFKALSGPATEWWVFSPARLRKRMYDAAAASAELRRAMVESEQLAEKLRRAAHKNRFVALWGIAENTDAAAKGSGS